MANLEVTSLASLEVARMLEGGNVMANKGTRYEVQGTLLGKAIFGRMGMWDIETEDGRVVRVCTSRRILGAEHTLYKNKSQYRDTGPSSIVKAEGYMRAGGDGKPLLQAEAFDVLTNVPYTTAASPWRYRKST